MLSSAIAAYYSFLLYRNLRSDIEELLPKTARSVVDLNDVAGRLESVDSLAVLAFSNKTEASKRFMIDLARETERRFPGLVSRVEYRIDQEIRFFRERRALFIQLADLIRIRNYIRKRIEYERELYNPLNIFQARKLPEPFLDFRQINDKYSRGISSYTRFPDGFYASRDQRIRVALVYPYGKTSGISEAEKLRAAVDQVVANLNPRSYAPDLEIRYTGDVENLIEEQTSLIKDLELSTVIVVLLVVGAMIAFFRDPRATSALLLSLGVGTMWTFCAGYFVVGYLNANSAFLGSIVIGNGINFGIIVLGRYLEDRRKGLAHPAALENALFRTLPATLTAALAAGLSYGSLMITRFQGFHQFGVIGLIGMVLCWISAYTMLPALLTLIDKRRSRHGGASLHARRSRFVEAIVFTVSRTSMLIMAVSWGLVLGTIGLAVTFRGELIQTDTSKLRDKTSMEKGSGYYSKFMDQVFERYVSPIVIAPLTAAQAKRIAAELKRYQKSLGKDRSLISAIYSLQDFVPPDQAKKIRVLREIKSLLRPSILYRLTPRDRRLAREFLTGQNLKPFRAEDLPPNIQARFREKSGALGNLVLVEPTLGAAIQTNAESQGRLISKLREVADSVEKGTPVVGQLAVTVDMYRSVRSDGPKATAVAFIAVFLLVIVIFRQLNVVLLVETTLCLGVIWLFGVILWADLQINFLNFIALPITFGIGVDYGVNIVQRYRLEGPGKVLDVVRSTGGAVMLASLTTMIGYGSLLIAGNQAFFSFGRLAILGEITSLLAAVVSLPAYLNFRDRPRAARGAPREREEDERHAA